jgi:hypothetical protein
VKSLFIVLRVWLAGMLALPGGVLAYTVDDNARTASSDGTRQDTIDMEAYVDGKNQDGWVMTIGSASGNYSWGTGTVTFDVNHDCTIQGASAVNRPTITITHSSATGISFVQTAGKKMKVKDLIVKSSGANDTLVRFSGADADTNPDTSLPSFLCHNVRFEDRSARAIWVEDSYGDINGCWFQLASGISAIEVQPRAHNAGWKGTTTYGNEQCVLLESNVCSNPSSSTVQQFFDSDQAARICGRFNRMTNFNIVSHGDDTSGVSNSCLQYELYGNIFKYDSVVAASGVDFAIFMRGGSTLGFSNQVLTSGGAALNYMVKQAFGGGDSACCGFGCSQHTFSWPGDQQIGRGVSNDVVGVSFPSYYWQNTWTTPVFSTFSECPNSFIDDGRDYFSNTAKPNYAGPLGVASWFAESQQGGGGSFAVGGFAGPSSFVGKQGN